MLVDAAAGTAEGGLTVDIHILQTAVQPEGEKLMLTEKRKKMPPCPICGSKAFLSHDIIDGFDFGYMAGCPRFCLDDGIHGIKEIYDAKAPRVDGYSAKDVYDKWLEYCERMKEG